jgi:hypothetical protein
MHDQAKGKPVFHAPGSLRAHLYRLRRTVRVKRAGSDQVLRLPASSRVAFGRLLVRRSRRKQESGPTGRKSMNGSVIWRETAQRRVKLRESRLDFFAGSGLIPRARLGGWFGCNDPSHRPPACLRSQHEREAQASPGRNRPPLGGRRVLRRAVRVLCLCDQGRVHGGLQERVLGRQTPRRAGA